MRNCTGLPREYLQMQQPWVILTRAAKDMQRRITKQCGATPGLALDRNHYCVRWLYAIQSYGFWGLTRANMLKVPWFITPAPGRGKKTRKAFTYLVELGTHPVERLDPASAGGRCDVRVLLFLLVQVEGAVHELLRALATHVRWGDSAVYRAATATQRMN